MAVEERDNAVRKKLVSKVVKELEKSAKEFEKAGKELEKAGKATAMKPKEKETFRCQKCHKLSTGEKHECFYQCFSWNF